MFDNCRCVDRTMRSSHIVQQGETLSEIASKYQVDLNRLIMTNPQIQNPDMIFPGQVIIIPTVQ